MSFNIGKIFGVEIRIHYSWFLIFGLITWTLAASFLPFQFPGLSVELYWILGAISALLLFISVLVHELAHTYVALKKGLSVSDITLYLFGGVSQIETEPTNPKTEALMSVVGPLTSFVIGGLSAGAWLLTAYLGLGSAVEAPLYYIALINVLLGGFNLLPAFPLDGGRLLRAGLWFYKKDIVPATRSATIIRRIIAYAIIGFGAFFILFVNLISGLWLILIGWFLKSGADESLRHTIIMEAIGNLQVEQIMTKTVSTIPPGKTILEAEKEFFDVDKHGGFPVVAEGKIVGIITRTDLKKVPEQEKATRKVEDVMTPRSKLVTVEPEELVSDAFMKLSNHNIGRLPVVEGESVIGIITRSDVIEAVQLRIHTHGGGI